MKTKKYSRSKRALALSMALIASSGFFIQKNVIANTGEDEFHVHENGVVCSWTEDLIFDHDQIHLLTSDYSVYNNVDGIEYVDDKFYYEGQLVKTFEDYYSYIARDEETDTNYGFGVGMNYIEPKGTVNIKFIRSSDIIKTDPLNLAHPTSTIIGVEVLD